MVGAVAEGAGVEARVTVCAAVGMTIFKDRFLRSLSGLWFMRLAEDPRGL